MERDPKSIFDKTPEELEKETQELAYQIYQHRVDCGCELCRSHGPEEDYRYARGMVESGKGDDFKRAFEERRKG